MQNQSQGEGFLRIVFRVSCIQDAVLIDDGEYSIYVLTQIKAAYIVRILITHQQDWQKRCLISIKDGFPASP